MNKGQTGLWLVVTVMIITIYVLWEIYARSSGDMGKSVVETVANIFLRLRL